MGVTGAVKRERMIPGKNPSNARRNRLAVKTACLMEQTIEFVDTEDFRSVPRAELLAELLLENKSGAVPPSETPPYLASLYEFPLLTRAEEYHLFRRMHFLRYEAARLQKTLSLSALNAGTVRRIHQLLRESAAVRNRIVQCNLRLVVSIAKTLTGPLNSLDELISEGNLPLIRAVEIFDFTRGLRFSTYATWAIRNGLYRVTNRNRVRQARLASADQEWLLEVADPAAQEQSVIDDSLVGRRLDQLIQRLDDRGQTIIQNRFGLSGDQPPAKFRELAEKLNLSSERVRQLLARAIGQLKDMLSE